jgi:hypothetical protein
MHRFQTGMAKPGVSLLLLELFNYRLLPLYRYSIHLPLDDELLLVFIVFPACVF